MNKPLLGQQQIDVAQKIVDGLALHERPEYKGKRVTSVVRTETFRVDLYLGWSIRGHGNRFVRFLYNSRENTGRVVY